MSSQNCQKAHNQPNSMSDIETILSRRAKPPTDTENQKCISVFNRISEVIRGSSLLYGKNVKVFRQGSYENRTNVKQDSDVDIVVCLYDTIFTDGLTEEDKLKMGMTVARYSYPQFKRDVEQILRAEFGSSVKRNNKCLYVEGNQYRVSADVVPCLEHRRYNNSKEYYDSGIEFITEKGEHIVNWPQQHYKNGVEKNRETNQAYKSIVRILKNAKNDMVEKSIIYDDAMPSFLLECLVWNVPNENFRYTTWRARTRAVLAKAFNDTLAKENSWDYVEISNMKWLFRGQTKWTHQTANVFLGRLWSYLGYE